MPGRKTYWALAALAMVVGGSYGGYPRHWGWGGGYYGYGTETTVRQYTKGMLAVDAILAGFPPS